MPKVALIMGSKSDWPSLRGCVDVLKGFEIEVEVHVANARDRCGLRGERARKRL